MKLQVDGVELYYESYGQGQPIVFSHAWLDNCTIWTSQVEHFSNNYNVILYDHRGHGRSDKPKIGEGNYSVQVLANDVHALVQKLDLERPILVGFSLGGMAATLFALEHSDKISRLVLVGTTSKMIPPTSAKALRILRMILPYESLLRIVCKYRFYRPSKRIFDEEVSRALEIDKTIAFEFWKEMTKNYDVRSKIFEIRVPTLIIVGQEDKVNLEASRYLNREIAGSELRIIQDSGHTVMIEQPHEFNQILEEFIK